MGPAAGVIRHAAKLAAVFSCAAPAIGCAFRDDVAIGSDVAGAAGTAGTGGGVMQLGGRAGAGAPSGGGGNAGAPFGAGGEGGGDPHLPPQPNACGLGRQSVTGFVVPHDSADAMGEGSGGRIVPGVYVLSALVEHGSCGCFDANVALYQTLVLDGQAGYLISDSAQGEHWATTFRYSVRDNTFTLFPTCSEVSSGVHAEGPFGWFASYTVSNDSLWLISPSCQYRAQYRRLPDPPTK